MPFLFCILFFMVLLVEFSLTKTTGINVVVYSIYIPRAHAKDSVSNEFSNHSI